MPKNMRHKNVFKSITYKSTFMNFKFLLTCAFAAAAISASAEAPYTYSIGDEVTANGKAYKVISENIVTNGDFSEGYTFWKTGAGSVIAEADFTIVEGGAPDGSNSLSAKTGGGGSGAGSIRTEIDLTNGKTYFVSLWGNTANCDWARIVINGDDNKAVITKAQLKTSAWKQASNVYTCTADNEKLTFMFSWLGNGAQFARINVVEVEELSAFAQAVAMAAQYTKENYPLAAEARFTALENACKLTASDENVAAVVNACRAIVESNSVAEAIEARVDATSYIVNPKAADGINGWTLAQGDGGANISSQSGDKPTYSTGEQCAYFDGGNWNGNDWTSRFEQNTTDLPAGKYRMALTARGSTGLRWFRLHVTNEAGVEKQIDLAHTGTDGGDFGSGYCDHVLDFETTGDILISVQANAQQAKNWQGFTNFRLTKIGEADFITENATKAIDNAQALIDNTVGGSAEGQYPTDLRSNLEKAFADAKTALNNTKDQPFSKELQTALDNATTALNEAITAYNAGKILVIADKWYFIKNSAANLYWYAVEVTENDGYTKHMRIRLSGTNPEVATAAAALPQDENNNHKFKFIAVEGEPGHYTIQNAADLVLNTDDAWVTYAYPQVEKASKFGIEEADGKILLATLKKKDGKACYMAPDNFEAETGVYNDKDRATAIEKGPLELVAVPNALLPSGIENVAADTLPADNTIYDLYGRRVTDPTPGIYIVNGKKTVIR